MLTIRPVDGRTESKGIGSSQCTQPQLKCRLAVSGVWCATEFARPIMLDLKSLLAQERGHLAALSEERINPSLCKVLKILGYNKRYTSGKGAYLFDEGGNRYI